MRKYRTISFTHRDNGPIESNCVDITFENKGTLSVTINDIVLATGDTFQVSGNTGEIDTTIYKPYFASGVGTKELAVVKRIYVK